MNGFEGVSIDQAGEETLQCNKTCEIFYIKRINRMHCCLSRRNICHQAELGYSPPDSLRSDICIKVVGLMLRSLKIAKNIDFSEEFNP